jgi:hypothetical protein
MYGGVSSITAKRDKLLLQQLNGKKEQGYGNKFLRQLFVRCELMVYAYSKPSSRILNRKDKERKELLLRCPHFYILPPLRALMRVLYDSVSIYWKDEARERFRADVNYMTYLR